MAGTTINSTPTCSPCYSQSLLETRSGSKALQELCRNTARMDECNLSFTLPTRQDFVEWFDCRRDRQKRRQTSMLLLIRSSSRQSGTRSKKLTATARSSRASQVAHRHDFRNRFDSSTNDGSTCLSNIQFCNCSLRGLATRMHSKSYPT